MHASFIKRIIDLNTLGMDTKTIANLLHLTEYAVQVTLENHAKKVKALRL